MKPWYLKKFWLFFFCILTPVLGYILVIWNLKKLEDVNEEGHSERFFYLTIATISAAFWIFKLMPHQIQIYTLAIIFTGILGTFLIKKFKI